MRNVCIMILTWFAAAAFAHAQSADESVGTERARLANQRIHSELERRAREEEQRQTESAVREAQQPAAGAPVSTAADDVPKSVDVASAEPAAVPPGSSMAPAGSTGGASADMSIVLEQLRTLGELRDAGYVTNEEFERIKKKILDDQI